MVTIMDYHTRRRLQNRMAQQKFRERSKKQKHSPAIQHQDDSSPPVLNYSPGDHIGHYGEIAATETWTETAVPSLIPGPLNSHFFSHQSSTLNTIPGELYTPQQYLEHSGLNNDKPSFSNPPEMFLYPETQGTNGLLELDLTLAGLATGGSGQRKEPPSEQETSNLVSAAMSHTPEIVLVGNQDGIYSPLDDDECQAPDDRMKDNALLVLQSQKVHFRKQAQEQIRRLISIYDLGVFLQIFPSDPRLKKALETTNDIFSSTWK